MPFFKHGFTLKCSFALKPTSQKKRKIFILSTILPYFDNKKTKIFYYEF